MVHVRFAPTSTGVTTGTFALTAGECVLTVDTVGRGRGASPAGSAPFNLDAHEVSRAEIALSWQDTNDRRAGFLIERRTGTEEFSTLISLGPDATTFADLRVGPNVRHTVTRTVFAPCSSPAARRRHRTKRRQRPVESGNRTSSSPVSRLRPGLESATPSRFARRSRIAGPISRSSRTPASTCPLQARTSCWASVR